MCEFAQTEEGYDKAVLATGPDSSFKLHKSAKSTTRVAIRLEPGGHQRRIVLDLDIIQELAGNREFLPT